MRMRTRAAARPMILAMMLAVGAGLTGCGGDPYEAVTEDMLGTMKEFNGVMKGITDEASAKEAKPKLEAVAKNFAAVKADMEKLGEPSKDQQAALEKKYKGELEAVMGEFMGHMLRVAGDPKIKPHLDEAMKDIQGAMK